MVPEFKILTEVSVLDISYENAKQDERDREALWEEQNMILKEKGFEMFSKSYKIHFFDSPYTYDFTEDIDIDEAIQCLAVKDGIDLVQYDSGNYGFVAYYNCCKNGFEIISESNNDVE